MKTKQGFSFVEWLAIVLVLMTLGAIAYPKFFPIQNQSEITKPKPTETQPNNSEE